MSTSLHASAREDLGLHQVHGNSSNEPPPNSSFLSISANTDASGQGLPKPLSLSPRTFGMDDFCSPLFKTGLTPRMFGSTGLTPRSGLTPRLFSGLTPRTFPPTNSSSNSNSSNMASSSNTSTHTDTTTFFQRNGDGPRENDPPMRYQSSGYTPKDMNGMKINMRFPGSYGGGNSPPKMGMQQDPMNHQMHKPHLSGHPQSAHSGPPPQQIAPSNQHHQHHNGGHESTLQRHQHMQHINSHHEMGPVGVGMFDYMNRPGVPTPPQSAPSNIRPNVSPMSEKTANLTQEELDERRRMKNRERVRKCRKRKQDRLNYLEDRTAELEKENGVLKSKLARKSDKQTTEPLTEEQMKELRKKQNTTIAAYIRAYNETDGNFSVNARNVWTSNVDIIYGVQGARLKGLDQLVANKADAAAVFSLFKIKQYNVEWKPDAADKCTVTWEVEASVKTDAPQTVTCTAPFAELSPFLNESDMLTFTMMSHLTFVDGKIAEETRLVNLMRIADDMVTRHASDPKKASEILKCMLCA